MKESNMTTTGGDEHCQYHSHRSKTDRTLTSLRQRNRSHYINSIKCNLVKNAHQNDAKESSSTFDHHNRFSNLLGTTTYTIPSRKLSFLSLLSVLLILFINLCFSQISLVRSLGNNEAGPIRLDNSVTNDRVYVVKQSATKPSSPVHSKLRFKEAFNKLVIHVKENTPVGTRLALIQPTEDELLNAGSVLTSPGQFTERISYKIIGGEDQDAFTLRVDEVRLPNEVELVNEVTFDYESDKRIYNLAIRAVSISFVYQVEVEVLVSDENDNKPQLDDFSIVFNNYKNNFPTGPIGRVPASDLDISDLLRYRVVEGNSAQLIIVNETTGEIQLLPWLNSNVQWVAPMDIAVFDGINEVVAKLYLKANLVTELMLHNSVTIQLDGIGRDEFFSKKFDIFLAQMARILTPQQMVSLGSSLTSSPLSGYHMNTKDIIVFNVEETHHPQTSSAETSLMSTTNDRSYYSTVVSRSPVSINVSFSAAAPGTNDIESYLSPKYIEERIFLNRIQLSQALDVQVAPFKDNICVLEPCPNYQECQMTHKFDHASKTFYTNKQMIFRSIKATESYTCSCPPTFTGMNHKKECNLQINQCFTNPCQNGGQCHRHESGYTCECKGDYFGPNCELNFANSTCQSATNAYMAAYNNNLQTRRRTSEMPGIASSALSMTQVCGGKSRCLDLNRSNLHFSSSLRGTKANLQLQQPTGSGFSCQGCPYSSQWTTDLCQLRARSFDKESYIVLPGLEGRHRFHLKLSFATVQSKAILVYNGRYNDKHDFIALEIVDSRLKFSFSLGGNTQVHSVTLSQVPVSNGDWHTVSVNYQDRNVTLVVDNCDPIIDEALARLQPNSANRCSNSSVQTQDLNSQDSSSSSQTNNEFKMLDLTGPMQIGAVPLGTNLVPQQFGSDLQSYSGCLSDIHLDHQLVDLSTAPLQDFGTQPGCPERRQYCQQQSCNSFPCQESYGSAKCQCGDERLGRSCEIYLSQEKTRKFNGNSYLTFNPIDSLVPANWQVSLYFRTINPNGVLFKIILDHRSAEATVVLELLNGGLKLIHRSQSTLLSSLNFNRLALDDGEWHFVEIGWSEHQVVQIQLDHNPNLAARSKEMGQLVGATMKSVIVGSSYTRLMSSSGLLAAAAAASSSLSSAAGTAAVPAIASAAEPSSSSVIVQAQPETSAEFTNLASTATTSTQAPPLSQYDFGADPYGYSYNATLGSSQSFIGCIYALNVSSSGIGSETAADWWLSPNDERNVERGCPIVDVCETQPCPAYSRCVKRGMNQRKCVCNPGYVGGGGGNQDQCIPVCDLQPCQGEQSRCVSTTLNGLQPLTTGNGGGGGELALEALQQVQQKSDQQPLYVCECAPNRSGKNCEHQLSAKCPSNWWGRPVVQHLASGAADSNNSSSSGGAVTTISSSLCGPCNCDESRGFDGDCDKTTGQCYCKPSHYQPQGADHCLPCDCYLVGSLSSTCNQTTGQCKCRPGVVGRRCDSCSGPYAEVTLRGCDVIYDACPKTYSDGIWWDKTPVNRWASQQCPVSTSTGTATRFCHEKEGWRQANLFDCISNTFSDLHTKYKYLEEDKLQISSDKALKIAEQLRQALNETISGTGAATGAAGGGGASSQLYGSDMYISFRLIHHLIQHETQQRGNLSDLTHKLDRYFIRNLVESINYLLDPAFAHNWPEIAARSPNGGAEYLLKLMDNYGRTLIETQSETSTQPFEIVTRYFTFGMDTVSTEQLYDMSKWQQHNGPSSDSQARQSYHSPSSPPYATEPFEPPQTPYHSRHSGSAGLGGGGAPLHDSTPGGRYNLEGMSIYLDFSATRDGSPSVVIPKYDNYLTDLSSDNAQQQTTKAVIPLRTLRVKTGKELGDRPHQTAAFPYFSSSAASSGAAAAAAKSRRARRDALLIPEYNSPRPKQPKPALVVYSLFKTLGPLLPNEYDSSVQNRLGLLAQANSPVVWLTARPANSSEFLHKNLQPKVTYMLKLLEPIGKTRPQCAIWDFAAPSLSSSSVAQQQQQQQQLAGLQAMSSSGANASAAQHTTAGLRVANKPLGRFTTRGCEIKGVHPNHRLRYKSDYVNCSCDHLGAVVVLMDSANYDFLTATGGDTEEEATNVRDLSLMIAFSLSLIILALCLFVLSCIRGHSIKSNSNSINKNLLVILIIIELLILYSISSRSSLNQLEYQCKLVAIFLHYFSICLFFWLLVNAIHFYRMLTELRDINHGPMKFYHILGYAVPAFFVSLAVGLRIEQFGNYLFCWLSIYEPIIWSMFGPVSAVSLLIIVLFKLALCKSLPLEKDIINQDPTGADLIKMHMIINATKTPLIGLYWLLTVWAVNEALADWWMILFPFIVALKSCLLFTLLCVLDKYIRYNLYVSWLRFRGEKVPFVDGQQRMNLYGNQDGEWQSSLMILPGGEFEVASQQQHQSKQAQQYYQSNASLGQILYGGGAGGNNSQLLMQQQQQQHAQTPGFQGSCTDIFRPELFSAFSATSTTSRSSATGTSSMVSGAYGRGPGLGGQGHEDDDGDDVDELDDLDGTSASDYGRARRGHSRRHRKHKKHHHHHRHHHHHHHHKHHSSSAHHHHHNKNSSSSQYHREPAINKDESLDSTNNNNNNNQFDEQSSVLDATDYATRRHSHGHHHHHHHHSSSGSRHYEGRSRSHHHHHGSRKRKEPRAGHYDRGDENSSSQQHLTSVADQNEDSYSPTERGPALASSHSSDVEESKFDERPSRPSAKLNQDEKITGDIISEQQVDNDGKQKTKSDDLRQQQTVPMELLTPSTSSNHGTQQLS